MPKPKSTLNTVISYDFMNRKHFLLFNIISGCIQSSQFMLDCCRCRCCYYCCCCRVYAIPNDRSFFSLSLGNRNYHKWIVPNWLILVFGPYVMIGVSENNPCEPKTINFIIGLLLCRPRTWEELFCYESLATHTIWQIAC